MDCEVDPKHSTMDDDLRMLEPRPYQLEMLDESLKRNVIVTVCHPQSKRRASTSRDLDGHGKRKNACVSQQSMSLISYTKPEVALC